MAQDNENKIDLKKPAVTGEDKTAKIPKPLKPAGAGEDDKVVLNSGTDSAIRPSDATRMAPAVIPPAQAEKTVSMEKTEPSADDSTQKTVKPPSPADSGKAKTIKLKPLTADDSENVDETVSMERDALSEMTPSSLGGAAPKPAAPTAPAPSVDDEATIKIEKPKNIKPSHPVPNIPGAKETIKLRPSTGTTPPPIPAPSPDDESQETVAMSKKTIRLIPKKPGADSADDSTQKTAKPSAPTVKLTDSQPPAPAAPAAPSAPTVTVPAPGASSPAAPKPSAPTVKLPEPKAPAPAGQTDGGSKKTLKLKSSGTTGTGAAAAPPAGGPGGAPPPPAGKKDLPPQKTAAPKGPGPAKGDNPGVVLTIAAVFAFLLMAYITWMSIGSWAEGMMDMTDNANVPMRSGEVKPPR